MDRNLFEVVQDGLFKPLSGKNKVLYADLLMVLYHESLIRSPEDFDKPYVLSVIEQTMQDQAAKLELDEGEEESQDTIPDQARAYRRLRDSGWLYEEYENGGNVLIRFSYGALPILRAIHEVTQHSRVSLGGYRISIQDGLKSVWTSPHPYIDGLSVASRNCDEFKTELSRIPSSIKDEMNSIIEMPDFNSAAERLEKYLDNSLEGDYYKAQFQENMSETQQDLFVEELEKIYYDDECVDRLVKDAKTHLQSASLEEAENEVRHRLQQMIHDMETVIRQHYSYIMRTQSQYYRSAHLRISILTESPQNDRGLIDRLIMAIEESKNGDEKAEEIFEQARDILSMPAPRFADSSSLYIPRKAALANSGTTEYIGTPRDLSTERDNMFRELRKVKGLKYIVNKVRKLMEGKESLETADLPLETEDDFYDAVLIPLFLLDGGGGYQVEMTGGRVEHGGFSCASYKITRRKGAKK